MYCLVLPCIDNVCPSCCCTYQAARTGAELSPAKKGNQAGSAGAEDNGGPTTREHLYRPLVKPMNMYPLLAAANLSSTPRQVERNDSEQLHWVGKVPATWGSTSTVMPHPAPSMPPVATAMDRYRAAITHRKTERDTSESLRPMLRSVSPTTPLENA